MLIGLESSVKSLSEISNLCNLDFTTFKERVFPNNEVLVRLEKYDLIENRNVVLYFPLYPNPNVKLVMLFEALSVLNDYKCKNIILVTPYLSYSRQDKRFMDGEAISLKVILDIMGRWPITHLITFNVHNYNALSKYSSFKVIDIDLTKDLVKKILGKIEDRETILISPDIGRVPLVSKLANELNLPFGYGIKERDRVSGKVTIKDVVGLEKRYEQAVIIDDEISTGGTMKLIVKYLKDNEYVERIYVGATHLLLVNDADKSLFKLGVHAIFGSNTIENKYIILKIEPYVANIIKNILT